MSLNFLITGKKNTLTTKHLKSYLMSIYMNVALDLTNYRFENGWHMTGDRHMTSDSLIA